MQIKQTTIIDIAKELNVSKSTVSRALNDHASIGEATKKAVRDLAKKYNYHPNNIASSLSKRSTKTIGVIVPLLSHYYFSTVIAGIEELAYKAGYKVIICQSAESYEREVIASQTLLSSKVDGLLVSISSETKNSDHFKAFQERNIPVIFFDRVCPDMEASSVIIDDYTGAFKAVEHLILQGRRQIAHLAGPPLLKISQNRVNGYKAALAKYNIPFQEELLITCDTGLERENAIAATQQLLDTGILPDAVFAFCDPLAIGAMMALKKNNLKIPEQVAVVGFCNEPMATVVEPALSTLVQPAFQIGEAAAQLCLNQIKSNVITVESKVFSTDLIVRDSSQKK
ncbi:LacI family DNA-binding transcriptional regulator [Adhaeribacter rhizoryzae]|uniref:LacI family transcriptional regulator n=1 Tax=Adhaeribacter rhizoryzae TaxID=2607907 RepID=A0A5M6D2J3_9BACT|nr:LacI family DNA-binding transcriptional regulator [Adhaeribacter rhizoryzae]KAA5541698.1 LacI family transcriptional regulator [Adhaeribacter rhizoryzae]